MNSVKLEYTGKNLKDSLNQLVTKDKYYRTLDDDKKENMIRAFMQEARDKAKADFLEENRLFRDLVNLAHQQTANF